MMFEFISNGKTSFEGSDGGCEDCGGGKTDEGGDSGNGVSPEHTL